MGQKVIAVTFLIILIFTPVLLVPLHVFQIKDLREGTVLYLEKVKPDFQFSLGFIHSVEQCPVWDYLKVNNNYQMVTYATKFWSSRTGLPYAAFGDEIFRAEGNHFIIENMNRVIPSVDQWVDATYDNTIRFGDGREFKLASLAGNTLLQMTIEQIHLGYYLYHKVKLAAACRRVCFKGF